MTTKKHLTLGDATVECVRLSEEEILTAIELYLQARGEMPPGTVGYFRYRLGLVGDPIITLAGDAVGMPDAGHVYCDWHYEQLPNVKPLPRKS